MPATNILYILPYFIASFSILTVSVYTLLKRRVYGSWHLIWLCVAASFWSFCEGLLYFGFETSVNIRITQIQYLGIVSVPPLLLTFVISIFGPRQWMKPIRTVLLFLVSICFLLLAWSNSFHHLIWTRYWTIDTFKFPMLGLEHGPLFWLMTLYSYTLLIVATIILLRRFKSTASIHRGQVLVILMPLGVVLLSNCVYLAGFSPISNMDTTPLAFVFAAGAMAWGFFRYNLLDILPVAKDTIFISLTDGILVLDSRDRIIDLNPAGEKMLGLKYSEAVGVDIEQVFKGETHLLSRISKQETAEVTRYIENTHRSYELHVSVLKDRLDNNLGRVLVWRDITERKQLEFELKKMATTDPLTGAYNRRQFMNVAQKEVERARRYMHPLSLLMIDIDHFKKINDTFGHSAGDEILKILVEGCLNILRENDLFGRLGGEEFAAVCVETDIKRANLVAERLRRELSDTTIQFDGVHIHFTVSIGVSHFRLDNDSLEETLKRADEALYRAKHSGRNRICEFC